MKRLFLVLTACVLLCSMGITCFAGESTLNDEKRRESFGIYVTYVGGEREDYTAPVHDGSSEIKLPDGTVITVSDIPGGMLTLIIYPITDEDEKAWEWIQSCMAESGSHPVPYEIYFLDGDGNCFPADGVTITVTVPDSMKNPSVFSLGTDGNIKALAVQVRDRKITFKANGSRYFVLVEKEGKVTPGSTEPQTESDNTGNTGNTGTRPQPDNNTSKTGIPQTGDDSRYEFWSVVLCLAGGFPVCYLMFLLSRKRKRSETNHHLM